ncbi:MAG: sulfurtransferase TusA family protein [Anaerolineales bacterium]
MMATVELDKVKSAKVVDARAMSCPGPLLEAKKAIGAVKVGEILEIWSGDPTTRANLDQWCKKLGHDFLGYIEAGGYDRLFILRKK